MMMIMTMIITSNDDKNDNDGDEIMTVTMKTMAKMAKMITTALMIDAKTEMVTMLMTVTARQALTTPPPAGAT